MSYKFDIEPFGENEMARKLSYKYDIEKQDKSLSQAKCPISLTVLYLWSDVKAKQIMVDFILLNNLVDLKYFTRL